MGWIFKCLKQYKKGSANCKIGQVAKCRMEVGLASAVFEEVSQHGVGIGILNLLF